MKKAGIVICNYNKTDYVLECIQCILESKFQDFDLYVVDNASTDGAPQAIKEKYGSQVTLIENAENLGGSGGFNTGLRIAYEKGYPYLMCVDNDAMLDENAIGELYRFLETHPEAGMAGSKIYHLEKPDYIQQFGQKIDFDIFCTEVPHLNRPEDGTMPDYLYVDSVAACSLMVRRSTVEKIGFLPEDNFLYWDDTEWCHKCRLAGMKVASVGTLKALHAMGAKQEAVNTFPTYYAWRNWISFFVKYTPEDKLEKMAETFLGSIFQVIYAGLHKGEDNAPRTVMLAYDDAVHGITGKAGDNRIFPVDVNLEPFRALFGSAGAFYVEENGFPTLHRRLREIARKLGAPVEWMDAPGKGAVTIALCENIFRIDDLSCKKVYVDIDRCILRTQEDVLDVINYNYSRRSFIYAQKPVFLEKARVLRRN
ncbi:MAG: glycosyltransferase family 2 protein [Lachnospiraceae bacterium]|nr:glycosyltransferase family 2 protein [Lachnospiraceae bacterium]